MVLVVIGGLKRDGRSGEDSCVPAGVSIQWLELSVIFSNP